jgi:hypothetical protein
MDITAIIERGLDGKYSVFIENKDYPYGIIGTGSSAREAIEDFQQGYEEMKTFVNESGDTFAEANITFKYDVPSFLQEFAFAFTLAGLERITGINQKQLGHYISGFRRPSPKTVRKIETGIHAFSRQLSAVQFV